jgi:hypothetical protein
MSEALKITNQDVISLFKEHFGDAGAVAEFMPKTSYDILAYIQYWKEKKLDASIGTWWKTTCNDQINKLERLMIAATDLAVDFIGQVENIEFKFANAEEPITDKENLLTLDE